MKALILTADTPNKNGRVYTSAVVAAALSKLEKPLPVYRSMPEFSEAPVSTRNDIVGTGTLMQEGLNLFAVVSFNSASIQHQVLLNGLSVRSSGLGQCDSNGTVCPDFEFTGLFFTGDPA